MLGRLISGMVAVFCLVAQTGPTFHSAVSLVHVDVAAYSRDGRILQGLSKDDFRVFDERQEQTILAFSAAEVPLDLILLFDASGSMRHQVQKVAAAATEALHELKQGDRVSVMAFNTDVFMATPFTENRESIELDVQEILRRRFGGGTMIRRAVDEAAQRLFDEARTDRRRAIMVITDNMGIPTPSESRVVRDLWEADTVLTGLLVKPGLISKRPWHPGGIENIAAKTGGEAIYTEDPGGDFPALVHRLRSRYDLYYAMPEAVKGTFRDIRIELSPQAQQSYPAAYLYARRGYRVPQ